MYCIAVGHFFVDAIAPLAIPGPQVVKPALEQEISAVLQAWPKFPKPWSFASLFQQAMELMTPRRIHIKLWINGIWIPWICKRVLLISTGYNLGNLYWEYTVSYVCVYIYILFYGPVSKLWYSWEPRNRRSPIVLVSELTDWHVFWDIFWHVRTCILTSLLTYWYILWQYLTHVWAYI